MAVLAVSAARQAMRATAVPAQSVLSPTQLAVPVATVVNVARRGPAAPVVRPAPAAAAALRVKPARRATRPQVVTAVPVAPGGPAITRISSVVMAAWVATRAAPAGAEPEAPGAPAPWAPMVTISSKAVHTLKRVQMR